MTRIPTSRARDRPEQGMRFIRSLLQSRELWWRLSEREIAGRYRGSILGWGWSLLTPLLMLGVYKVMY